MINFQEYKTITDEQLERWWKFGKNVILLGNKGVGKSTIIENFFEKKKIKNAVFSGATLDPWTDLVGIPKVFEDGDKLYTRFAIPENIPDDVEVIYIDEINRALPKVQSCLLELMISKSINGRKFPKLRAVWGAGNPPDTDENYAVEELCPALEDRFHIKIKLADEPNLAYFTKVYGEVIAENAINWRQRLDSELKTLVSPRRLDYALDYVINCGGPVREVLADTRINVSALMRAIRGNEATQELSDAVKAKDTKKLKAFFKNQKKVQQSLPDILTNSEWTKKLVNYADVEYLFGLADSEAKISPLVANGAITRGDISTGIEDANKANGAYPVWYVNGSRKLGEARAALAYFETEKGHHPPSDALIEIPDIDLDLAPEDILSTIPMAASRFLVGLSKESALQILKLSKHIKSTGFIFGADMERRKYQSLVISAFNHFYEDDGNLLAVEFNTPETLDLVYECCASTDASATSRRGRGRSIMEEQL